jgi:asparagine synthase (glutamine-hydrolysing)
MAMIAALAHRDGVKVLLSGEGADELFAGYDFLHGAEYRAVLPASARLRQRVELVRARADALRRRGGRGLWRGLRRRASGGTGEPSFLPAWAASAAAHAEEVRERARRAYAHHPGPEGELEAALLGDLSTYLPHLLNRQDKNTMQASIETRVPFLDPAVVALALNLPVSARTQPLRKGVLRDVGARHLPRAIARRAKVGFGFDVRRYLAPASRPDFLRDGVLRDTLEVPRAQWDDLAAVAASHGALRLWTGEIWCRLFLEGQDEATVETALWRN